MSDQQYIYFEEMPVSTLFSMNGNRCKKVSTRTAVLLNYNRWFYFGMRELCIVGKHDRLGEGYDK